MNEILILIVQMSPYILLGFLLAGIMHAFVPQNIYRKYLGGSSFRSVLYATLFGIPLPLCSCGVIPTAMSLRKEGASKGATVSFLIATPQTGVDSIIATYSLMGLPFALLRPVAALVTALFGGLMVNITDKTDRDTDIYSCIAAADTGKGIIGKIIRALRYAFIEMMQDIGRWLLLGLVIAGCITVFVPDSFFEIFADRPLLSMLLVLLFAIPMYLCATGSIPIAVALMLKGLSPGTALVLLMAGPAVNAASILVIGKVMGHKTLILYLVSIIAGAVAFGLGIDYLMPREWFTSTLENIHSCSYEAYSLFNVLCAIFLTLLMANALIQRYIKKKNIKDMEQQESVLVINVKGMSCNHCKSSVERAVSAIDGVKSAEVDLASGNVVIHGDADKGTIIKSIENLGFTVSE